MMKNMHEYDKVMSLSYKEQEYNMNLSQDIGVFHNDKQDLCSTDGNIKSLGVTEEAKGMLFIKSNNTLIASHLKQQRSKLNTIKFIS